ncbi:hypothetical protein ACHAWO_008672 [Cyclotella atomus]|uniref:Uncharacterized protein n=1 Tax=Cyclotella atomus TaxID=382360 RepID=A0ABD3N781_9STRA
MTMTSTESKAKLSFYTDILSTISILFLSTCWIYSLSYPNQPLLSTSFLQNGFCLSPLFDNTHYRCSQFDAACGILCLLFVLLTNKNKQAMIGVASYFFAHSYGHYDAAVSLAEEGAASEVLDHVGVKEVVVLGAILSIGPMACAAELIEVGKVKKGVGYGWAVLGLAAGVAVYAVYIRRPCYALLYINVFIILANSLPRAVLIGYTTKRDVQIRAEKFKWANVLSGLAVLAVVMCEPFFCDGFTKYIGGHALFDAALALNMLIEVLSSDGEKSHDAGLKKME